MNITVSNWEKVFSDTYFPESLYANKHSVMVPNILLRLSPDGVVLYSSRVTVIGKCPMNLQDFPLDTQVSIIVINLIIPQECVILTLTSGQQLF